MEGLNVSKCNGNEYSDVYCGVGMEIKQYSNSREVKECICLGGDEKSPNKKKRE
jgi:hypothetical protein